MHYRKMRQSRWVEKWQPSCRAPVSPRTSSSSHRTSRSPNPRQHLRYSGLGCVCFYFERLTAVCFWLCLHHISYCGKKKKERISYLIFKETHLWSSRGLSTVTTFAPRLLDWLNLSKAVSLLAWQSPHNAASFHHTQCLICCAYIALDAEQI